MTTLGVLDDIAAAIAHELHTSDRQLCRRIARAAVLALREPTPDMLDAALPDVLDWGDLPEDWRKMIDFVASGREPPGRPLVA